MSIVLKDLILLYKTAATRFKKEVENNSLNEEEINKVKQNTDAEILRKYIDQPGVFIHFSEIERFGFNPKSIFDTPFGIYGYPLTTKLFSLMSSFATERKYIHIFKVNGKCLDIANYSESDFNDDLEKIKRLLYSEFPELVFDDFINECKKQSKIQTPIGYLWNITRKIGVIKGTEKEKNIKQKDLITTAYNEKTKQYETKFITSLNLNAFEWSKILKKLGYSWVIDTNASGLIHSNEPYQGFCLVDKGNFEHLATIENTKSKIIELLSPEVYYAFKNKDEKNKLEFCDICKNKIKKAKKIKDATFCDKCFDKEYFKCELCENYYEYIHNKIIIDNHRYCNGCFEKYFNTCDYCYQDILNSKLTQINNGDNVICDNCLAANLINCNKCSKSSTLDNISKVNKYNGNIENYCNECMSKFVDVYECASCYKTFKEENCYIVPPGDAKACKECNDKFGYNGKFINIHKYNTYQDWIENSTKTLFQNKESSS